MMGRSLSGRASGSLVALCLCVLPVLAHGYTYTVFNSNGEILKNQAIGNPTVWPPGQTDPLDMTLNFRGDFLDSALSALQEWNDVGTPLQWRAGVVRAETCGDDGVNSAGFQLVTCENRKFGDAIAVTNRTYKQFAPGGAWYLVEADIAIDDNRSWSAQCSGAISGGPCPNINDNDFRRVFLHELGHALGLDHPDEASPPQSVTAIMNSRTSDIEFLQDDDKAGVALLYSLQGGAPIIGGAPISDGGGSGGGGAWSPLALLLCMAGLGGALRQR